MTKLIIKLFSKENVRIHITDFELLKTTFYGCDARFEYEVRDKETDTLLDTTYDTIENAFMGVDDSEEIYYFLEEKGIDFSAEYDEDSRYVVIEDDITECAFPDYDGQAGDGLYNYYAI